MDVSFGVNLNFRSHTKSSLKIGKGAIVYMSQKNEHKNQHGGRVSRRGLRVRSNTICQAVSRIPSI